MSVVPNYVASTNIRNNSTSCPSSSSSDETFEKFFECWVGEQESHLRDLISAANADQTSPPPLGPLISRVVQHYEHYYRAKARWARRDAAAMLRPAWRSSLEDAFMWVGGWRPSMAFHLLYSKSGLQLLGKLTDVVSGVVTGDLGDISAAQLAAVNALQGRTIAEEREISEDMARHQETLACSNMVELSGGGGAEATEARIESALRPMERGLRELLKKADDLRLRTLKAVLEVLTPLQNVHFLIAAAELHLRIHEWGQKRDATLRHQRQTENSS